MELNEEIEEKSKGLENWNEHIRKHIQENLQNALRKRNNENVDIIEIGDIGAIDSIEDGIVRLEILDGSMIEVKKDKFEYDVQEGDVINLKLTYKEGKIEIIDILDKNDEEKLVRIQMMQDKLRQIRNKRRD